MDERPINPGTRWIAELPIYLIAGALFAVCAALLGARDVPLDLAPIAANAHIFVLSAMAMLVVLAVAELIRKRPEDPLAHLRARATHFAPHVIAGLPLLALLVLLMPFFSKMKAAIPLFTEYDWDARFIAWDRAIFGGYDAWEVIQPVFGYPVVTAALALLYQLWFLLLFVGTLWFAFASASAPMRRQFFLTYVLSWTVIGGGMATWLASVGPCFVGPLMGDPTFDAQMDYLNRANEQVPVMTLAVQQMLLDWFSADANGLGSGITAMPSMHCAIAALYWLAVRRLSAKAGRLFFVFFALIWIGSVHLAYHYAVDGLVSLIAVIALWKISAAILQGWDALVARSAQAALRTKTVPAE